MPDSLDEVRHQNYFDATVDVISDYLKTVKEPVVDFFVVTMNLPVDTAGHHLDPQLEKFRFLDEEEVVDVDAEDIPYQINLHYVDAIWITGNKDYRVSDTCDQIRWVLDADAFQSLKNICRDNVFSYKDTGCKKNGKFVCSERTSCWGKQVNTGANTTSFIEKEIGSPVYAYDPAAHVITIGFGYFFKYEWKKSWLGFGLTVAIIRLIVLMFSLGFGTFFAHIGWCLGNAFGFFLAGVFICLLYCLVYATIRTIIEASKRKKSERKPE